MDKWESIGFDLWLECCKENPHLFKKDLKLFRKWVIGKIDWLDFNSRLTRV